MAFTTDEIVRRSRPEAADRVEATGPLVARIVVPVDGSPFAERALPVAAWLGREVDAPLHLVQVVAGPEGVEAAIRHLDGLARRYAIASWDTSPGDDPAAAIIAATQTDGPGLACLATHGRDRSAALLGSVAKSVLDRATQPVMLVGPKARPPCAGDAPVVAAVDGSPSDSAVVGVAAGWAAQLRRRLVVATVAEPVPGSFHEGKPLRRARGPEDPEGYVATLAAGAAAAGCAVETRVVYDPISVRSGLVHMVNRTATLLVTGTHRRTPPLRALVGSHTARIVHDIEVPALVVPLDAGT